MRYVIIIFVLIAAFPVKVCAEIVVIVNSESNIKSLTRHEVIDIFMGRTAYLPNGDRLQAFDFPPGSKVRAKFYQDLTGKPVSAIDAYWARLLFAGRSAPPRQVNDIQEMADNVEKNKNAIGYMEKENLDDSVKVIFKLTRNE